MKRIYIFFIMLIITALSYGFNFSVAPTSFELDLNKTATSEIYIFNNTSQPLRIETYFEEDKDFGAEYNLNKNIAVFPKTVALKPGGKQTVRFRVRPGKDLKDGEYKSYIFFKELPHEIKSKAKEENKGGGANVTILTELGISVYGHIGEEIVKGSLNNVKATYQKKNLILEGDTFSEGNTSIRFFYEIHGEKGFFREGILGYSKRNGKNKIGLVVGEFPELAGKEIKVKIYDQNDKVYYNKKIKL